jgi:hypothetical protein
MATTPRMEGAVEGQPTTFGGILAHQPHLARQFSEAYAIFWSHGVLDHPTKEAVRIRNARITDCGY